jgi:SAM-dependent methyltransferase
MNQMGIEQLLDCPICHHGIQYEKKENISHGIENGVVTCSYCGNRWAVINSVFINSNNPTNEEAISQFNRTLKTPLSLGESSEYIEYSKDTYQYHRYSLLETVKKFLAASYYILILFLIFFLTLLKKPTSDPEKYIVAEKLADMYSFGPEMAIQKYNEILALFHVLPVNNLGTVLDIGGGNGNVASVIFDYYGYEYRINSDIFGIPTSNYDFILSEDIKQTAMKDGLVDTAISICVLEHIPDCFTVFPIIYNKLKPGGAFVFSTPHPQYYSALVLYRLLSTISPGAAKKYASFDIQNAFHVSLNPQGDVFEALKKEGFKEISGYAFYSSNNLFLYDLLNLPAKLPRAWHFWIEFRYSLDKMPRIKKIFKTMLKNILLRLDLTRNGKKQFTHILYYCKKIM